MKITCVAAMFLSACYSPDIALDITSSAPIPNEYAVRAEIAWQAVGLPDPKSCLRDVFQYRARDDSQYRLLCEQSLEKRSALCLLEIPGPMWVVITPPKACCAETKISSEPNAAMHLFLHSLSECVYADADIDHERDVVWMDAENAAKSMRLSNR